MNLKKNWLEIIKKAWSIRLMIIAGIFSGLEVGIQLVNPELLGIPTGLFAIISAFFTCAAFVARLMAQENIKD